MLRRDARRARREANAMLDMEHTIGPPEFDFDSESQHGLVAAVDCLPVTMRGARHENLERANVCRDRPGPRDFAEHCRLALSLCVGGVEKKFCRP